jgi:hypothetical protein
VIGCKITWVDRGILVGYAVVVKVGSGVEVPVGGSVAVGVKVGVAVGGGVAVGISVATCCIAIKVASSSSVGARV